ncbi:hypothetical protein PEBR_29779 [Penicillium brasilianum]|uniref:HTH CENPB-type domain-containing protein n=1 Tax=Penicillium brasilianum TaxID=104259 RepID=A0A1S9RG41_PENBI|nr:hypothetical protein PEBR_29779 [Penicillium brasilianum]
MPPIRSESSHKLANQEGKILLALSDLKEGRISSIRAAAKLYEIPYTTLHARADGRVSRVDKRPSGHKLTQTEEDALAEWILSMDSRGAAPRPATVGEMANILLATRGSNPPPTVGVNWPSSFIKRRDELRSRFSRRYDYQRALNEDPKSIRQWFTTVQRTIDEKGIQPEDIYNFDETGFAMGLISSQKVVTRAEYYGRPRLLQPGNREWVTAIEAICADGYSLPPCIVFKGKVAIAGWFNENLPKDWRIEVSANGWTTHEIGLRWLQKIFIPYTNSRVRENDIIPLCMPAHSSHLLQPLDVGCFAVVKRAYGRFVSDLARRGYNYIDKHDFLVDYQHARLEAFQSTNPTIKNSFAASGLVPLDAERVLNKLNISLRTPTPPNSRPSSRSSEFTPQTPRTATQLFKQASMLKDLLKRRSNSPPSPSKEILDQMIKGFQLALHSSALLAEDNANLRMANEKMVKKRNRSTKKIPCEEGLTIEEAIQLATQLNQPEEDDGVDSHAEVELPSDPVGRVIRSAVDYVT